MGLFGSTGHLFKPLSMYSAAITATGRDVGIYKALATDMLVVLW